MFVNPLAPVLVTGGCISIYKDAWPESEDTIKMLEEAGKNYEHSEFVWSRAMTNGGGIHQDHRTNRTADLTFAASYGKDLNIRAIHNGISLTLQSAIEDFKSKFMDDNAVLQAESLQVLKYSTGQEYKVHADSGPGVIRDISAILYLNDDYEGGELEFPYFDVKIKPSAGMYILFPSSFPYAHIARPVISGTKYAVVTWLRQIQ
jgi:hypothetical protein